MHLNVLLLLKVHAIVWGSMIVSGESVCQNHSDASVRLRLVYAGWKYIMPAGCHKTTGKTTRTIFVFWHPGNGRNMPIVLGNGYNMAIGLTIQIEFQCQGHHC